MNDTRSDAVGIATSLYVAGYPLVVSTRTFARYAHRLGPNRLAVQPELSGPNHRTIVAPNRDTLYALAVVDLRAGPVSFTHPPVSDRYFSYQLMDMWTESFAYIGTRTDGGRGGTWLITPPGWAGEVPAGATTIASPTPQLFLLGRYLVDDDRDVTNVRAITDAVTISWLGGGPPDLPAAEPARGRPQSVPADATFFDELAAALAVNPPATPADRDLAHEWDRIRADRPPSVEALDAAAVAGRALITARDGRRGVGPWSVDLLTGRYGSDTVRRARVAHVGWGANVPEESVYAVAFLDDDGHGLDGRRSYRITLAPGYLPPVNAFWSLSMYGADMFFAEHPSGRYTVGDRTPDLRLTADGALHIDIGHLRPELTPEPANWLPAPAAPFCLMLRLYLPRAEVLAGTYRWPPIQPIA